ncbi:prepilin-type N-terminal cleavage/methylation domain-containing protein [Chitinilyticum litopenaei]|uniref:prepilin-type N-terminal cleavage/methylation domain-containing protein n=1 Tax=Chitinilyticum litopenaei TaxID=1121276 RepID=UPI0003FC3FAA|nr:prepilin-type N-terminal cleavage/methylation domain-containing protein [Chitinilyticum litopenaei]
MCRADWRPAPWRAAGFTLLELLVALAVMAVLATLAFSGLGRIQSHLLATEAEVDHWQHLNAAMELLADGLRHADRVTGEASQVAVERGPERLTHAVADGHWQVGDASGVEKLVPARDWQLAYLDAGQQWRSDWREASVPVAVRYRLSVPGPYPDSPPRRFERWVVLR